MAERRGPLYDIHLRTAARMVKGGGDYLFPWAYSAPVEEHLNVRRNLGMQDLTSMGEVDVKGPGAERLLARLFVANIRDLLPGQLRYTTMCREDGRIIDDVTVYKFGDEHFMVVTSSSPRKTTFRWIADHAQAMSAYVNDVSGAIALISVQGPRSRDFLASMVRDPAALQGLRFFRFSPNQVEDTELIVSRSGYTGELGYELYVPAEEAAGLWELLERRGKEFGLLPYGVGAMQSLRIEKALPLAGPDIDGDQTPFELGLHKWIDFSKREFIGREALLAAQERGLRQRWVGLVLDGTAPANPGDAVYSATDVLADRPRTAMDIDANEEFDAERSGGNLIGRITSSVFGPSVGKPLALAYLDVSHTWPGARVLLASGGGRPVTATVTSTPFFDPAGLRLRGTTEFAPQENSGGDSARSGKGRGDAGRKPRGER